MQTHCVYYSYRLLLLFVQIVGICHMDCLVSLASRALQSLYRSMLYGIEVFQLSGWILHQSASSVRLLSAEIFRYVDLLQLNTRKPTDENSSEVKTDLKTD